MLLDIRFCFDGWYPDQVNTMPFLRCATDFGDSCSQYIINITDSVRTGLDYYGEQLTCFLFRSSPDFRLGRTSDRSSSSSGSYLKFHYYGDHLPSNQSRIHVTFYNKYHDPNLPVYNIHDPYNLPKFNWYSKDENAAFQAAEQANLRTDNAFDLDTNTVSTGSYELSERQVIISDNVWNKYSGIGTSRSVMHQIQSQAMSEPAAAHYNSIPAPMGAFNVFPSRYEIAVSREQRAFTLLNAMGIIGGISGLLLGLQALLFGFRPRSPWGWGKFIFIKGCIDCVLIHYHHLSLSYIPLCIHQSTAGRLDKCVGLCCMVYDLVSLKEPTYPLCILYIVAFRWYKENIKSK